MGRRRGQTGPGGAVVSSSSAASGGVLRGGGEDRLRNLDAPKSSVGAASGGIGRTPSNLLREWCYRQKRYRPRFDHLKSGSVRCVVPPGKRGEPRGAKNEPKVVTGEGKDEELAALAVLAEVEHGKPLHRVLPPDFRPLWNEWEEKWERREKEASKRVICAEQKDKAIADNKKRALQAKKRAVDVTLSADSRLFIEDVVLEAKQKNKDDEGGGKSDDSDGGSDSASDSAQDVSGLVRRLQRLGFAASDAEMAVQLGGAHYSMAMDWLCLNLDENELPKSFAPKADLEVVRDGILVDASAAVDLSRKLATSRLAAERALRNAGGDYRKGMLNLFETVVGTNPSAVDASEVPHDAAEKRAEEVEVLEAIYCDDVSFGRDSHEIFSVSVQLHSVPITSGALVLEFSDAEDTYPYSAPVITVASKETMSASVRRAIMRAVTFEARRLRASHSTQVPIHIINEILSYILQTTYDNILTDAQKLAHHIRTLSAQRPTSGLEPPDESKDVQTATPKRSRRPKAVPPQGRRKFEARPPQNIMARRKSLPAYAKRREIATRIHNNQVVVISGATGSGKTTQVPQFILDEVIDPKEVDDAFIIVTQPRRLAAVSVAQRVAAERGQKIGQEVGYQVRLDSRISQDTKLVFCTTGVLLRRLQGDAKLGSVSHVIVDEVHERSIETDILLLLLREVLKTRKDLRVVLMSATLNAEQFAEYFASSGDSATKRGKKVVVQESWDMEETSATKVPTLTIEGRTYPVEEKYLEDALDISGFRLKRGDKGTKWDERREEEGDDSMALASLDSLRLTLRLIDERFVNLELISRLLAAIDRQTGEDKTGSILVFLPGVADINALVRKLNDVSGLWPVPLHALLSPEEQSRAFSRPPRVDLRKVVCSTNVAETSITVEDVVYVVDSVRVKISGFDAMNHASVLQENFVSKASARQRAGRAGRVQAGICYRLVKRETFAQLRNNDEPELRRSSLDRTCLTVLATLERDPREMLRLAVDPPNAKAVEASLESLVSIGAITRTTDAGRAFKLTALGAHLATLPTDVRVGKLLIYASLFGCVDPALSIAAAMAERAPFPNREVKQAFNWGKSDLLALAKLYKSFASAADQRKFCETNMISRRVMTSIENGRKQLADALSDTGFDENADDNATSVRVIKGVICAALYPNVVRVDSPKQRFRVVAGGAVVDEDRTEARELKLRLKDGKRVFLDTGSVNFDESSIPSGWLAYNEKICRGVGKSSKILLRDSTMVAPFALLLFGGEIAVRHERSILTVDHWIEFNSPARVGVLVRELRDQLDQLLWKKINNPGLDLTNSTVLNAILKLLREES